MREWGAKHGCPGCSVKFDDLRRATPACLRCGTVIDIQTGRRKQCRPPPQAPHPAEDPSCTAHAGAPRVWLVAARRGPSLGGHSSVGRALEWHSRGRGFDSPWLHQFPFPPMSHLPETRCNPRNSRRSQSLSGTLVPISENRSPGERHDACRGTAPARDCQPRVRPGAVKPRRGRQGGGAWRRPGSRPAGVCSGIPEAAGGRHAAPSPPRNGAPPAPRSRRRS